MFRRKWKDCEGNEKFFDYNPAWEQKQKEDHSSYLVAVATIQAISPGKNSSYSVEAPLYTDKKFAQPGSG